MSVKPTARMTPIAIPEECLEKDMVCVSVWGDLWGVSLCSAPPIAGEATGVCNITTETCMVRAWCPVEEENKNMFVLYLELCCGVL